METDQPKSDIYFKTQRRTHLNENVVYSAIITLNLVIAPEQSVLERKKRTLFILVKDCYKLVYQMYILQMENSSVAHCQVGNEIRSRESNPTFSINHQTTNPSLYILEFGFVKQGQHFENASDEEVTKADFFKSFSSKKCLLGDFHPPTPVATGLLRKDLLMFILVNTSEAYANQIELKHCFIAYLISI